MRKGKDCGCKWVQVTKNENGNIRAHAEMDYCETHKPKVNEDFARMMAESLEKAKQLREAAPADDFDIKMNELQRLEALPKTPEIERQIADLLKVLEAM